MEPMSELLSSCLRCLLRGQRVEVGVTRPMSLVTQLASQVTVEDGTSLSVLFCLSVAIRARTQFSGISGWALPLPLFPPLASSRRRLPYLSWYPLRPSPCLRDQKMSLMSANGTNKQKYKLGLPPRCLLGHCKFTHVYNEGCNIYAYDIYGIYGGLSMCQAGCSVLHTHPLRQPYGHLAMSE